MFDKPTWYQILNKLIVVYLSLVIYNTKYKILKSGGNMSKKKI